MNTPGDPSRRTASSADDKGSIAPMVIGFSLIALVLVAVVTNASAAYLARQNLNAAADAAALAATNGVQGEAIYDAKPGERLRLSPDRARSYAAASLAESGLRDRYESLSYQVSVRDARVIVAVSSRVELPFRVPGVDVSANVTGSAESVARISE